MILLIIKLLDIVIVLLLCGVIVRTLPVENSNAASGVSMIDMKHTCLQLLLNYRYVRFESQFKSNELDAGHCRYSYSWRASRELYHLIQAEVHIYKAS